MPSTQFDVALLECDHGGKSAVHCTERCALRPGEARHRPGKMPNVYTSNVFQKWNKWKNTAVGTR